MIASRLGLAVLAAIAVVLAAIVSLGGPGDAPAVDRSLVPGFDADAVTELVWARPGHPDVQLVRDRGAWRWTNPAGAANARGVNDVLAALRGARWHRRVEAARAGTVRTSLTLATGLARRTLGIAGTLAGTEQAWLVDGDHALLVDGWVARALDPEPLALRDTAPLAGAAGAKTIAITEPGAAFASWSLEGQPRRLHRTSSIGSQILWPDPARVGALEEALRGLTIVELPDGTTPPATGPTIALPDATVTIAGACANARIAIRSASGDGCVTASSWRAVRNALDAFARPDKDLLDRRPVPIDITRVVLDDGAVLELAGDPHVTIGSAREDADPARALELVAALAAPGEIVAMPPRQTTGTGGSAGTTAITTTSPLGRLRRLVATDRAGTSVSLLGFPNGAVARDDEPVALQLAPGAFAALIRPGAAYRTRLLWREEPTTITSVTLDGVTWQRGDVLGEWRRDGKPAAPAPAIEALITQLAAPTALDGDPPHGFAAAHRVTLVVTAPGTPATHALELGAPIASGCPVRAGGREVILPAQVCAARP